MTVSSYTPNNGLKSSRENIVNKNINKEEVRWVAVVDVLWSLDPLSEHITSSPSIYQAFIHWVRPSSLSSHYLSFLIWVIFITVCFLAYLLHFSYIPLLACFVLFFPRFFPPVDCRWFDFWLKEFCFLTMGPIICGGSCDDIIIAVLWGAQGFMSLSPLTPILLASILFVNFFHALLSEMSGFRKLFIFHFEVLSIGQRSKFSGSVRQGVTNWDLHKVDSINETKCQLHLGH